MHTSKDLMWRRMWKILQNFHETKQGPDDHQPRRRLGPVAADQVRSLVLSPSDSSWADETTLPLLYDRSTAAIWCPSGRRPRRISYCSCDRSWILPKENAATVETSPIAIGSDKTQRGFRNELCRVLSYLFSSQNFSFLDTVAFRFYLTNIVQSWSN